MTRRVVGWVFGVQGLSTASTEMQLFSGEAAATIFGIVDHWQRKRRESVAQNLSGKVWRG
jgi:hypothetical protein